MTVTVEVINNRALNLLSDMEHLDLIRLYVPTKTPNHLAGALKLSDERHDFYQKALLEGRDEWDRDI